MKANAEARLGQLDRALDVGSASVEFANELFAVNDALSGQPGVRRALSDQGASEEARVGLVRSLFGGKVSDAALRVVSEAVRLRWPTVGALTNALERQGVRVALAAAQAEGRLDEVEDQLFKVERLVDSDRELRNALANRQVGAGARQQLLADLLGDRVHPVVALLARRGVLARQRTFDLTVEGYLKLAAELRQRGVATVEVARPLTPEQDQRLRAALSRQVGREVTLRVIVDPAVLGGIRVSLGDEVIEGTVAGRLDDARRKLS